MLFPTRLRVKLSSQFSYPVGAEAISSELARVPQAQDFEISFYSKFEGLEIRGMPYEIFAVSYTGPSGYEPGWKIRVYAVRRALKPVVRESLRAEIFPILRRWLEQRAGLESKYGSHRIASFWMKQVSSSYELRSIIRRMRIQSIWSANEY